MSDKRPGLTGWAVRAAAATLVLAALARLGTDPIQSRVATPILAPSQDRITASPGRPLRLAGMTPREVESVLNVRERMRYGQSLWNDAGVPPGPLWVRVDRDAQILSVFRGGHEIATAVILYGAPEKPTPAGRYPVLGKKLHHVSGSYGAEMPYTLWLTRDGVAIHASNVRQGAATHGCVGLPKDFARRLFDQVRLGDPVVIV